MRHVSIIRVEHAVEDKDAVRGFAETTYAAKSWKREGRVSGRIEATRLGLDIRYVVISIMTGAAEWLYADLYCARGQAENLIKLHKAQLASDRTSCRAATVNQMRLFLHTAAYWLILAVRDVKRGDGKGYAGIVNALFYADNCEMVYGDAQAVLVKMIEAVRGLGLSAAA